MRTFPHLVRISFQVTVLRMYPGSWRVPQWISKKNLIFFLTRDMRVWIFPTDYHRILLCTDGLPRSPIPILNISPFHPNKIELEQWLWDEGEQFMGFHLSHLWRHNSNAEAINTRLDFLAIDFLLNLTFLFHPMQELRLKSLLMGINFFFLLRVLKKM